MTSPRSHQNCPLRRTEVGAYAKLPGTPNPATGIRIGTKNVPQVYTRSERKSSETCFDKSAVTDHIVKANQVTDLEGANVVDREYIQRLRQVKDAIKIHLS